MSASIIVAGGGIGGLAAGAALRQAGCEVEIFERAPAGRPEGSGITVQANAMLVMRALGLEQRVMAEGCVLTEGALFDHEGRVLERMDLAAMTPVDACGVAIHRTRLLDALREAAPPVTHGVAVEGFEPTEAGVVVRLSDGSTRRADALVGADGLRSRVRAGLLGDEPLRYAGYTTWRGVARGVASDGRATGEYWGPGARFGVVPIGHGETYWFAVRNAPEGGSDEGDPREGLLGLFGGWPEPIGALIEATPREAVIRTDTFDRPPSPKWGAGRVTLLGDAAHPMTPNLGQGAAQALEDALVLARQVEATPGDLEGALRRYEAQRQPRAAWMVEASWQMGAIGQWEGAFARGVRNLLLRMTPKGAVKRRLAKVYAAPLEAA